MFQSFEDRADGSAGPGRLAALRAEMVKEGLSGFIIPRADRHQGEYVAACDERLAWLTGFTGSAGFAVALRDKAAVFVDGRYTLQVRDQVDTIHYSPVDWPKIQLGAWLAENASDGDNIGFDPWLHTKADIEKAAKAAPKVELVPCENLVDRIWTDRPSPPTSPARLHPLEFAGQSSADKRQEIASTLRDADQKAAVLTLPDSIAWLLNIRGDDVSHVPIVHGLAILHSNGDVDLFSDPAKFEGLDIDASLHSWAEFDECLGKLSGPVRVDPESSPMHVWQVLEAAGIDAVAGRDPCILPKACKNVSELKGMRDAHLRDAVAMVEFLAWLEAEGHKGNLTEIDVVTRLETCRRANNALQDISFETICGAGPNGAIVHYRVTEATNRAVNPGELLLVDSGGQYVDGTTDITRTIAIGTPTQEQRQAFTLVLKGVIAISMVRFPSGLAGRDLDALARVPLWSFGKDYDHGTGHGVGAYLSVHEGPQRISRISHEKLLPGMILSNEPGYYKPGEFGIRIENLIVVQTAPPLPEGDDRDMLDFETITFVPIDRNLIEPDLLTGPEKDWLNGYHAEVAAKVTGSLSPDAERWLAGATAPI